MDRRSFLKNTGWSFLGLAASGSLLGSCVAGSKEAKKIMPCLLYTSANEFLERISLKLDTYTETDRKLGIIYMAEARTLRGLLYFELVRRYGCLLYTSY